MGTNKNFEWLDIKKFRAEPMAALEDLGLESFPHLAVMVATCLLVINGKRRRKSTPENNKPFVENGINDINNLQIIAAALKMMDERFQQSMLHEFFLSQRSKKEFSLPDFLSKWPHEVLSSGTSLGLPWDLDIGDVLAVQTLIALDNAHANLMIGDVDTALRLYATAKNYYDNIATELYLPQANLARIGKEMGRQSVINRRATAGGQALRDKAQIERDAIRPFVYELLRNEKPHKWKTANAACNYLLDDVRSFFAKAPPPGMPKNYVMSESAFKSVVKEYIENTQTVKGRFAKATL